MSICLLFVMGLTFTAATTLAMDCAREQAGSASALLGALGFLSGSIVSPAGRAGKPAGFHRHDFCHLRRLFCRLRLYGATQRSKFLRPTKRIKYTDKNGSFRSRFCFCCNQRCTGV